MSCFPSRKCRFGASDIKNGIKPDSKEISTKFVVSYYPNLRRVAYMMYITKPYLIFLFLF